jgi:hypothetical protein
MEKPLFPPPAFLPLAALTAAQGCLQAARAGSEGFDPVDANAIGRYIGKLSDILEYLDFGLELFTDLQHAQNEISQICLGSTARRSGIQKVRIQRIGGGVTSTSTDAIRYLGDGRRVVRRKRFRRHLFE